MTTETSETVAVSDTVVRPTPLPIGNWNREEFLARLDEIERRKNDPEDDAYVRRLAEGAEEARRQINEAERRALDEEAK